MSVATAFQKRRDVKNFDPGQKMNKKEIEKLLSLTVQPPVAFNLDNWRFVAVQDPKLKKKIRDASWDQAQITDASLLIILCADLKAWDREPIRYWRSTPKSVSDFIVPAMRDYFTGLDQMQRDEAMRSCGIAAQTIMLAAKSMGYDSCPLECCDSDSVGELINLPHDHAICLFVAVGKAIDEPSEHSKAKQPLDGVVISDRF